MSNDEDKPDDLGEDLYREMLIDHYQNPRNHGVLDPADIDQEGDNPACGDRVRVTARVRDGKLAEILFEGTGCAISQATASILYDSLLGEPVTKADAMTREDVEGMIGITLRPARVKCGVLGLNSLKHGIKTYRAKDAPSDRPPGFR